MKTIIVMLVLLFMASCSTQQGVPLTEEEMNLDWGEKHADEKPLNLPES